MAKAKAQAAISFKKKPKVSRPGVHAKTKQSANKSSKNYKKRYAGQGH